MKVLTFAKDEDMEYFLNHC